MTSQRIFAKLYVYAFAPVAQVDRAPDFNLECPCRNAGGRIGLYARIASSEMLHSMVGDNECDGEKAFRLANWQERQEVSEVFKAG